MRGDGELIRKTVMITAYYCAVGGTVTYLWVNGLRADLGAVALVVVLGVLAGIVSWMIRRDHRGTSHTA